MKPIYYKCKSNGDCFKLIMQDNIPQSQIDACLDAVGYKNSEFITENEFNSAYKETMVIDVFDTTDSYKIGELITKLLNLDETETI
jgi:hypothetical protein